jgi:hypothetical protein
MLLDVIFNVVFEGVMTKVYANRFARVPQTNGGKQLAIFSYVIEYWTWRQSMNELGSFILNSKANLTNKRAVFCEEGFIS